MQKKQVKDPNFSETTDMLQASKQKYQDVYIISMSEATQLLYQFL